MWVVPINYVYQHLYLTRQDIKFILELDHLTIVSLKVLNGLRKVLWTLMLLIYNVICSHDCAILTFYLNMFL